MHPIVHLGFGLVVASLAACAGASDGANPQQAGMARRADSAATGEFSVDTMTVESPLDLPAQLYVEHDAIIVARAQGTIDSLFVELGDRVTAGRILATLESTDQEIALANADATYENLTRIANRARALTKSGGATAADSEQAEYQLRQADIARRKARRDLELTRVAAPFDGVVSARFVRPHRFVAIGDTLFRVSEAAPLFARLRVPESDAQRLRIGQAATVVGNDGERASATLVHASPIVDAASATREAVFRLANGDARLVAGSSVRVRLPGERRNVITVPRAAVAPDGYVVVAEHGRTTIRPVILGGDVGNDRIEIVSGVSLGERLVRPGT